VAHGAIDIGNQQIRLQGVVHIGYIFLIHVPGFRGGMPLAVELVIPGEIQALQVVVSVLTTVERVEAAVEIVTARAPGVANTGIKRWFCIRLAHARGNIIACRQPDLVKPVIAQFERQVDAGLGVRVIGVKQRMTVRVIVRR